VRLYWAAPRVALRDCGRCAAWWYDEKTGSVRLDHRRQPLPRPPAVKPPCSSCEKVPEDVRKGKPPQLVTSKDAVQVTPEVLAVLDHYLMCKAVGRFPADPIVERHAAILARLEEARDRHEAAQRHQELTTVLGLLRRA